MSITLTHWSKNGLDRFYVNGLGNVAGKMWLEADRDGKISIRSCREMKISHGSVLPLWEGDVINALEARGVNALSATFADLVSAYEAAVLVAA